MSQSQAFQPFSDGLTSKITMKMRGVEPTLGHKRTRIGGSPLRRSSQRQSDALCQADFTLAYENLANLKPEEYDSYVPRLASAPPAVWLCAGHAQQLGGASPPPNLMEVKG